MKYLVVLLLVCLAGIYADPDCDIVSSGKPRINGRLQVDVDSLGHPVYIAYTIQGDCHIAAITLVFVDVDLGRTGWKCQQAVLSADFCTIAIDPRGFGGSSAPIPTVPYDYSFAQQATDIHTLLSKLSLNNIVWVGVDTSGSVGIKYTFLFHDDQAPIALILADVTPAAIVSDDPCNGLAQLPTAVAAGLSAAFAADPVGLATGVYATSFDDINCQDLIGPIQTQAINFLAVVPSAVFTQLFTVAFTENLVFLLPNITIPVLVLASNLNSLGSAQAVGVSKFGFNTIPSVGCPNPTPYLPFRNATILEFAGKGVAPQRTDVHRYNHYVREFANGNIWDCCVCPLSF